MPADEMHRCWRIECCRCSGCSGADSGCLVMKWYEARSVVRTPTCFLRYNVRRTERERERERGGGASVRSPLLLGARGRTDHMDSKVPFFNGASIWARADSPGDRRIHQSRARERGITSPVPSICRNWAGTGVGPCVRVRTSEEGESGPGVFLPPRSSQLHALRRGNRSGCNIWRCRKSFRRKAFLICSNHRYVPSVQCVCASLLVSQR